METVIVRVLRGTRETVIDPGGFFDLDYARTGAEVSAPFELQDCSCESRDSHG